MTAVVIGSYSVEEDEIRSGCLDREHSRALAEGSVIRVGDNVQLLVSQDIAWLELQSLGRREDRNDSFIVRQSKSREFLLQIY